MLHTLDDEEDSYAGQYVFTNVINSGLLGAGMMVALWAALTVTKGIHFLELLVTFTVALFVFLGCFAQIRLCIWLVMIFYAAVGLSAVATIMELLRYQLASHSGRAGQSLRSIMQGAGPLTDPNAGDAEWNAAEQAMN